MCELYGEGKKGSYKIIHQKIVNNVFVPGNCLIILDENLLHAGTELLSIKWLLPYTHSPRYFAYVHHKDRKVDENYTFKDVEYYDNNCQFCKDEKCIRKSDKLQDSLHALQSRYLKRNSSRENSDLVADVWLFGMV